MKRNEIKFPYYKSTTKRTYSIKSFIHVKNIFRLLLILANKYNKENISLNHMKKKNKKKSKGAHKIKVFKKNSRE